MRLAMTRRWGLFVAGGVLTIAIGVAVYRVSDTAEEAIELAEEQGEKKLRDPMRASRGGPRVLVFALDGVGDEELMRALRDGELSHLSKLVGEPRGERSFAHGFAVPDVLSILPSTTMAAWASIFTGAPPAETGVPGNEWFDRRTGRFHAPAPVSVEEREDTLALYTDGLLGALSRAPTLFERADRRSYVALAPISRGADLLVVPSPADVAGLFAEVAAGVIDDDPVLRAPYEAVDRASASGMVEAIERHGLADLAVVYFPGIDLYTHLAEPPLDKQRRYLEEVLDAAIGEVLDAYRARGALEETYVLVVSDHGHTPVRSDEAHALGGGEGGEPPDVLERVGFRVRPFELDAELGDSQAVFAYQGAMAYVYLADRSTCPDAGDRCEFERPPRFEQDVLPVVRAFEGSTRQGDPVRGLRGTLDLVLARSPRARGEPAAPFEIWDGERLMPIGAYLEAHPRDDLLRFEERMRDLAVGPEGHVAGDVLLLARTGANRPIGERYYFSHRYRSWHGSPEAQDSRVPLLVAHRGVGGRELEKRTRELLGGRASQLDITPLIESLLAR